MKSINFIKRYYVILVTLLPLLTFSSAFAQKIMPNNSAFSDPNINLSNLTPVECRSIVVGLTVTVTLQSNNAMIGTFVVNADGNITFNFPDEMIDPGRGIFVFDIGAGQTWSNQSVASANRTLTAAFTTRTKRPFVYKIIFKITAQSKGAFAISGKSES